MNIREYKPVALVSTVDHIIGDFPSRCVIIFDSEYDAALYAVACIVKHDPGVKVLEEQGLWQFEEDEGDEYNEELFYDNPVEVLERWQDRLESTEYFHIKPVQTW